MITIFGTGLAATVEEASFPLPAVLAGTSATIEGQNLQLLYVSPNQINAIVSSGLILPVEIPAFLQVTGTWGSIRVPVRLAPTAPGIFTRDNG